MTWPVQKVDLSPPPLSDLVPAIQAGLTSHFNSVTVEIAVPPDLREAPFHLAAAGLSGHPRVADVGGQAHLAPHTDFSKQYDLRAIARLMEMSEESGCLIGASAGPFHVIGRNTELVPNLSYGVAALNNTTASLMNNQTHYAMITENGDAVCEKLTPSYPTTDCGLMANLLGVDGIQGPILHIRAKGRFGSRNFTNAIQDGIQGVYGDRLISLGGVFVVHQGTVNVHVMPDFPSPPFTSRDQVNGWLRFFDVPAPLVCLTVFHSGDDRGLALRMEHTHCFSGEGGGHGGHYHGDVEGTGEEVEYEGWLNVADVLYRIDQPS